MKQHIEEVEATNMPQNSSVHLLNKNLNFSCGPILHNQIGASSDSQLKDDDSMAGNRLL